VSDAKSAIAHRVDHVGRQSLVDGKAVGGYLLGFLTDWTYRQDGGCFIPIDFTQTSFCKRSSAAGDIMSCRLCCQSSNLRMRCYGEI
jgi:hypothetical protein